nr:hypothetical protein [Corynebacterium lactis]
MAPEHADGTAHMSRQIQHAGGVPRIDHLISQVTDLIAELDEVSASAAEQLAKVPEGRRRHAENLLHYAHLRTIDIRGLQNSLHDLGVTSLTTAESFTRGRLELALNALLAMDGRTSDIDIARLIADDARADLELDRNATELFGPSAPRTCPRTSW